MKLLDHRSVSVIWCDDVRTEIGNKPSFMGVYTGALVVPDLPTILPRLAVWIDVYTPKSRPFKSLKVRVCKDNEAYSLGEVQVPNEQLAVAVEQIRVESTNCHSLGEPARALKFSLAILLGQTILSESSKWFKVFVDADDELLESYKLPIVTIKVSAELDARSV